MSFNFPDSWGPFPGAQFPYTQTGALNMDWIIRSIQQLETDYEQFVAQNSVKYADPIQWNITSQYERATVVIDPATNIAYISTQPVPNGIAITDTDYWVPVFDLSHSRSQYFIDVLNPPSNLTPPDNTGSEDSTKSLTDIFNYAAENNYAVLLRPGTYLCGSLSIAVPVFFAKGAVLDNSGTITMEYLPIAGRWKCFDGSVIFNGEGTVFPEWFGAANDGATPSSAAITRAIASITRGAIDFLPGTRVQSGGAWVAGSRSYLIDRPIVFNKAFCKITCSAGLACWYSTNTNIVTVGSNSTSSRLESQVFEHIMLVTGADQQEPSDSAQSSYALILRGTEHAFINDLQIIGTPRGVCCDYTVATRLSEISVRPAISGNYLSGRGFWINGNNHNWSLYISNCGYSGYSEAARSDWVLYYDGKEMRDLYVDGLEASNAGNGINLAGTTYGNDMLFRMVVLDQIFNTCVNYTPNLRDAYVRFDSCYFSHRASTARAHALSGNGMILYNNCEFNDAKTDAAGILITTVSVSITNCRFRNIGMAISSDGLLSCIGCSFFTPYNSTYKYIINVTGGSNNLIMGCWFTSNNSSAADIDLVSTTGGNTTVIGCAASGTFANLHTPGTAYSSVHVNRLGDNNIPNLNQ